MLYLCIQAVQNRSLYWAYWYKSSRVAIPVAHLFFLIAMQHQKLLAGLSADICLMYYTMEHTEIIDTMNRNVRIEFISQEQEEQPSSE